MKTEMNCLALETTNRNVEIFDQLKTPKSAPGKGPVHISLSAKTIIRPKQPSVCDSACSSQTFPDKSETPPEPISLDLYLRQTLPADQSTDVCSYHQNLATDWSTQVPPLGRASFVFLQLLIIRRRFSVNANKAIVIRLGGAIVRCHPHQLYSRSTLLDQ